MSKCDVRRHDALEAPHLCRVHSLHWKQSLVFVVPDFAVGVSNSRGATGCTIAAAERSAPGHTGADVSVLVRNTKLGTVAVVGEFRSWGCIPSFDT